MRVLVLGGTGLISQQIVRQLAGRGDEVTIMNRGRTTVELPAAVTRLAGDRGSLAAIRSWAEDARPDCVIDMIGYSAAEAAELANLADRLIPRVLYCSTVDVFAKPQPSYPVREGARRAASPAFPYAAGKVESELLLEEAAATGAFALTVLRPAQTYGGPGHGPVHPLGHRDYQLWRICQGLPLILHGDGTSLWSACHARDVAAAFAAAAHEPGARGRDYNLASAELVTWRRYWEVVGQAFARRAPEIITLPSETLARQFGEDGSWLLENFRYNNVFDCRAAAADLGFESRTALSDGMAELAADYGAMWLAAGRAEADGDFAARYDQTVAWARQLASSGIRETETGREISGRDLTER
jgi:nucleoside-diphosphate-sugar epimerase